MTCERCGTAYAREADPYGTGDYWYVVYEPNCDCEETQESDEDE